jgi:Protein of unknown function (DUF3298)
MKTALVQRILDVLPIIGIVGVALVGVFVAMNLLVAAIPADATPSPSALIALGSPTQAPDLTFVAAMPTPTATPMKTVALPTAAPTIWRGVVQAKDPHGVWSAIMYYPEFAPGTTPLGNAMNADMAAEVQARLEQWEVGPAAVRAGKGKVNQLAGNFTVEMTSPTLASFTLTWYDNVSGTDPTTNVETINYDLGTGARLGITDIFPDTSAGLAILSVQSQAMLQAYLGKDYDANIVSQGTAASPSNFATWSFTTGGLKITFPEYQVAPYSDGMPEIVIPWSALRDVVPATGPVARLAGKQP